MVCSIPCNADTNFLLNGKDYCLTKFHTEKYKCTLIIVTKTLFRENAMFTQFLRRKKIQIKYPSEKKTRFFLIAILILHHSKMNAKPYIYRVSFLIINKI